MRQSLLRRAARGNPVFRTGRHRLFNRLARIARTGVLSNSTIIWTRLGQRFRCLLVRLACRSLRNHVFAEGAAGHVTPDTS